MSDSVRNTSPGTDTRETIVEEAVRLFNEMGYADTRLEDIGARLSTAKTSISYHFKSKERLLAEVYGRAISFSEKAMADAERKPDGLTAVLAWVAAHARAHSAALSGDERPLALIADLPSLAIEDQSSVMTRYATLVKTCESILDRGINDGSIVVPSKLAALFFILNTLHWLPRWLADVRLVDRETAIDGLIDLLEKGLATNMARPPARTIIESLSDNVQIAFDRAARNKLKREAFLRAGTRALNEHGYRSLSLNDVAGELGVTRGAFYYHIADKDALLEGCFDRSCDLIETAQALAEDDKLLAIDILERALRWLYDRQVSNLDPLTRLSLLSALGSKAKLRVKTRLNRLKAGFADVIVRGMMDGSIRTVELEAIEQLVIGSIFAGSHRRHKSLYVSILSAEPSDQTSASAYYSVLLNGLSGGKGQTSSNR